MLVPIIAAIVIIGFIGWGVWHVSHTLSRALK